MMSQRSRREILEHTRARYLKGSKAEKQNILDELTATTGRVKSKENVTEKR